MRKSGRNRKRAEIASIGRKEAKKEKEGESEREREGENIYSVSFHTYIYLITITGKYMTICTASCKL